MRGIRLSQGLFALVDDDQYERLNTFTWSAHEHKSGRTYAVGRNEDGIWRSMHLLIMDMSRDYPVPRHLVVDHLDDNGLNNQCRNLEVITREESTRRYHARRAARQSKRLSRRHV